MAPAVSHDKVVSALREQGRLIFACHIRDINEEWWAFRDKHIGAAWSDTDGNHPDMTIYFSPAANYDVNQLRNNYAQFLVESHEP